MHCEARRAGTNLETLLAKVSAVPFDELASRRYGAVRDALEKRGAPIGPLDTLIASHALAGGYVLATHNVRELRRVVGLRVEDWLAAT